MHQPAQQDSEFNISEVHQTLCGVCVWLEALLTSLHHDPVDIAALPDDIFHRLHRHVGCQVADKHLQVTGDSTLCFSIVAKGLGRSEGVSLCTKFDRDSGHHTVRAKPLR